MGEILSRFIDDDTRRLIRKLPLGDRYRLAEELRKKIITEKYKVKKSYGRKKRK